MAFKGQTIRNKITGEQVTFLETAADTNGERMKFLLEVEPKGFVTVNHFHPGQEEKFLMQEGELKVQLGKNTMTLKSGEMLTIAAGQSHQWWNISDTNKAKLEVTFTPAGNMETFLEQYYGLANDDRCDANGTPPFMQVMSFSNTYKLYVSGPPLIIQRIMSAVLGPIARLMGYKKFYPAYASQKRT